VRLTNDLDGEEKYGSLVGNLGVEKLAQVDQALKFNMALD
jgi:hypothetical protein